MAASNHSVDQFWQMLLGTEPDLDAINVKGCYITQIKYSKAGLKGGSHGLLFTSRNLFSYKSQCSA